MKKLMFAAVAASFAIASPVLAAKPIKVTKADPVAASLGGGGCIGDLTLSVGSTLVNCYGRVDKNALSNSDNATINTALTALGYTGTPITYGSLADASIMSELKGKKTVDFGGVFNGTIFLGAHFGGGEGGPSNSTTFYRIDASNLDIIALNLNASSTVTVLARIPAPAIPEPATWAMMLVGFGMMAVSMRYVRRGTKVAFA